MIPKRKRSPYPVQAPLTSLIDIVFMLLIFFLLTTSFITDATIPIELPRARASSLKADPVLKVEVDRSGQAFMDQKPLGEAELFGILKERLERSVKKAVQVRADRDVALERVVRVMDTAKAAGAMTLSLATEKGGG